MEKAKSNCKRMTVHAMGFDYQGNIAYATNYNETECKNIPGACGCIHAEIALLQIMPRPARVVVSHAPCLDCAKALHKAGVEAVYYANDYRLRDGLEYLERHVPKVYRI